MICHNCHARNAPSAFHCHACESSLRDDEPSGAAPRRRSAWPLGLLLAAGLVWGAARGGDKLGDWFVRTAPQRTPDGRADLDARYTMWKQAHALPLEDLMALYVDDARVQNMNSQIGVAGLRSLAASARSNQTFDQVSDAQPPQIEADGVRAVVRAVHRYGHSRGGAMRGDRVLIWEKRGGQWLVVEDRFPTSYSNTP